jgi:DNA replication protein DnaC
MRDLARWNEKMRGFYIENSHFTDRIKEDLKNIPEPDSLPEEVTSCFISAPTGFGKTLYSCWLLLREQRNLFLKAEIKECEFISISMLFQKIESTFNNPELKEWDIINHYSNIHLLVLDDLGTRKASDWFMDTLYMIINNRYEGLKKTIITSNFTLEELSKNFGDDRITSRIERMGKVIGKKNWR